MDKKHTFNNVVELYDKRRPGYGEELFKDILEYGSINHEKSLLEVGCGTGIATEPFLKSNCRVTAVELGEKLAAYTEEKFKKYEKFTVVRTGFEDFKCEEKYHMVYSATAFHWIPEEIGYKKVYDSLYKGGTAALFWNRPSVDAPKDEVHKKIDELYKEIVPELKFDSRTSEEVEKMYEHINNKLKEVGFNDVETKLYRNVRSMTGEEYVELLETYSSHILLDKDKKEELYKGIRNVINQAGDEIVMNVTVDLHLGRK